MLQGRWNFQCIVKWTFFSAMIYQVKTDLQNCKTNYKKNVLDPNIYIHNHKM